MTKMPETERLILRCFRSEDARALYENHMDPEVRKWFSNECYADPEEAKDAIRFYRECVNGKRLPYVLGVELKETGELIGDTGISAVEGKKDETEIGYCIGEKYRNRGYATELLKAMTGFVFSEFGTKVIYGRVVHGNEASVKVLEKNGYRFVKEEFGAEDDLYGKGMLVFRKERFSAYEEILDRAEQAARRYEEARRDCEKLEEDLKKLERYYTGPEWKEDFEADEAGLLPAGLKRGVLSEDGIDNILEWFREFRNPGREEP